MRNDSETGKVESREVAVLASIPELLEAPGPSAVHFAGPGESGGDATLPVLLEIGCEEIPARFLADAERQLGERLEKALIEAHLVRQEAGAVAIAATESGKRQRRATKPPDKSRSRVKTFSTPRRLIAHVGSLLEKQPDRTEEVVGPPVTVAFDAEGKPTRAAESFASKNGVEVKDLLQVETAKGLYLAAKKTTIGRAAVEVLADLLPKVIAGMTFPKSMVWEDTSVRFVRPIRWIVALLGEGDQSKIIPFEVAGVKSGSVTRSHRLARKPHLAVTGFKDYTNKLRRGRVEIDPDRRRRRVRQQIQKLLASDVRELVSSLEPEASPPAPNSDVSIPENWDPASSLVPDADLEGWVVASTEWPRPILGSFEQRFLELPREILITVMRDHQKYFALEPTGSEGAPAVGPESRGGRLMPSFVTVLNVPGDPQGIIRRGHERVLASRFSDAEFFWQTDQKISLDERYASGWLNRVIYHEKLGSLASYGKKVSRMETIGQEVCLVMRGLGKLDQRETADALRAIQLCKCDLTTQMVQEFTELQGVVGGLYAEAQGELNTVAVAIYDHYHPMGIEDVCPRSDAGAVVAVADKFDAVLAGFAAGLDPTGSSDPFGLRRAGNGLMRIAVEALPGLDLREMLFALPAKLDLALDTSTVKRVEAFLQERVEHYLRDVTGIRYDAARAVVRSKLGWDTPFDANQRGLALQEFVSTSSFIALSQATKRTRNILTKSARIDFPAGKQNIRPDLFEQPEERILFEAFEEMWNKLLTLEQQKDYTGAFRALSTMRTPIDEFFDRVLVMTDQEDVRNNRLTLLNSMNAFIFSRLADLSELEAAAAPDS